MSKSSVFPHAIQIFQTRDLSRFGVLKKKMQSELPFGNDNRTVRFIQNGFHSLKQTLAEDNVRNAFRMLAFEFDITQTPCTPLLREKKLRESQGLRDIWDSDYPPDQISKRRRAGRYG